jgi:matrixin/putative peptidoglycan binding protein
LENYHMLNRIPIKVGLSSGDRGEEVRFLHEYLRRFGYIGTEKREVFGAKVDFRRATAPPANEEVFDSTTNEALKRFQEFNKLPVTGMLDKETANLMSTPRCDNPDLVEGQEEDYLVVGRWSRTNLSYRFENFTPDLVQAVARNAIQDAFRQWSSVAPLNFNEVTAGEDMRISWRARDHGDGKPFDGPSGILGHGFYPEDGRLHFDEDETWTVNNPPTGMDLATVSVHELGHSLGLGHSSDTNAVMYAYFGGIRRDLRSDDIAGIQSIYGARWASLGGVITTDPTVTNNADGRLEIFVRGTDDALHHIWQTAPNNGWSGWGFLGGELNGNIGVGRNADGRLEIFVRGTDDALHHIWQTAPNNGWL